jgi:hypothetical protein
MDRQLYGISTPQGREKYGLGSFLKSVAKTFIPKELDPVLKIAAPFLGPVYGPIAAIAGSARTGKINPLSLALTMAPYVQFGGVGQAGGLGSFMPTGYGGAQYGAFGGDYVGLGTQGKSLSSILTDKAKEFLSPTSPNPITPTFKTPTQVDLTGIDDLGQLGYSQGATIPQVGPDQLTYSTTGTRTNLSGIDDLGQLGYKPGYTIPDQQLGRSAQELQSTLVSGGGLDPREVARSPQELINTYGTRPGTQPGYLELIKKAGSLENVPLSERFSAVQQLGGKAIEDIYTTPVRNKDTGEIIARNLDKTAVFASIAGAASFVEAKKIADDAGLDNTEFNEEIYQQLKINPEKAKLTSTLRPEAFGIRNLSATGGRIGYAQGSDPMEGVLSITLTPNQPRENFQVGGMKKDMSNNRMSQIIQLIRDAEAIGDMEKAEELRLDLFRETKKAKGGSIDLPIRKNQAGITELDMRAKGGYIPVGIKEKADDVPAMLSKNEFVFTADAVRGAGNGSINKGAQKMYKLMKSLEKKVKKQNNKVIKWQMQQQPRYHDRPRI